MTVASLRETDAQRVPVDKLDAIRAKMRELRDEQIVKAELEEKLKAHNIRINDLLWSELPTVMDENLVRSFEIGPEGNKPPLSISIEDYYKANIPAERQEEAYAFLKTRKAEDLIKKQFIISFGLGEAKQAEAFERNLVKAKVPFEVKQGVPWNTLTAWFREEYRKRPVSFKTATLELLGATVGRVAKVVKAKEKK